MKKIFHIFKIKKDEVWLALVSTIIFTCLNALTVCKYYGSFSQLSDHYHRLFVKTFHVSGFDPLTYEVVSNWDTAYNVFRHPLLAFFMYPFSQVNQGLIMVTGMNFATVITAVILIACATYSCLFLYRIFREVIVTGRKEAYALCAFYFSFAFVMLSTMVPDHFVMSMTALLLTLYISGKKLKNGSALNMWQTIGLFVLTAGISLNNGLKVILAALFTRRKRFFEWRFLLFAVVIPCALIWGFVKWEYKTYVWPKEMARYEAKVKKRHDKAVRDSIERVRQDSIAKLQPVKVVASQTGGMTGDSAKAGNPEHQGKTGKPKKRIKQGRPMGNGAFMRWTDVTTSRLDAIVENLFGEGIQLHEDHLLEDVLVSRPMFVKYSAWANYLVESLVAVLFLVGIWCGRKQLFLWTVMSFFLMDMALHLGLGFGINEIYIMSPHYLFAVPVAVAYIYKTRFMEVNAKWRALFTSFISLLALWCWAWNVRLVLQYMI